MVKNDMDKKTTEEKLFNKALEIAVSKSQVKDPKGVDPLRSGQQGLVYRLISSDGKVLTRIGMGLLRKPRKVKVHNVCSYLIAGFVGFLFLAWGGMILATVCLFLINKFFISITKKPFSFLRWFIWFWIGVSASFIHLLHNPPLCLFSPYCDEMYSGSSQSSTAKNTIATIAKECAVKEAVGEINPTFEVPELTGYVIYPSDGSCGGDEFGEIKAIRKKEYEDKAEFDFWSWESSSIPWSPNIPKEIKYNPKTGAKTCMSGDDESYCKDGRW